MGGTEEEVGESHYLSMCCEECEARPRWGQGQAFLPPALVQAVQLSVHLGMHMSHFFASCQPLGTGLAFCECVGV